MKTDLLNQLNDECDNENYYWGCG